MWFDLNGWLTWAYGTLDGVVPRARQLAWSEYTRNTLANHATIWPEHWDGTISVDDVCYAYYSAHPSYCGNGLGTTLRGPDHRAADLDGDGRDPPGRCHARPRTATTSPRTSR